MAKQGKKKSRYRMPLPHPVTQVSPLLLPKPLSSLIGRALSVAVPSHHDAHHAVIVRHLVRLFFFFLFTKKKLFCFFGGDSILGFGFTF